MTWSSALGAFQINPLGLSPAPVLIALGLICATVLPVRLKRLEDRGGQPLFSMSLFDDRSFLVSSVIITIFSVLAGAIPFIAPIFLQQALGFEGVRAALIIMSFSFGSTILSLASGNLVHRMEPLTVMQMFLLVVVVETVMILGAASPDATLLHLMLPMMVVGAGFGAVHSQLRDTQM